MRDEAQRSEPQTAKPLVLVADDSSDALEALTDLLGRAGFRVLSADSGRRALALVAEARPDVVVLDVMLPGLDGLEVTRQLRRRAATRALPVLLLTGHANEAALRAGRAAGCDAFFTKPFEPSALVREVRKLVAGRPSRRVRARPLSPARAVRGAAPDADARDAREQMISVLAHDVRDPLSVILVSSQLLLRGAPPGGADRRHIEAIGRAADEIDETLRELVDTARLGSGRLDLERAPVEAGPLVDEAIALVEAMAERRSIRFDVSLPSGAVLGDRARLLRAFHKLLEGAVRSAPERGTVVLRGERLDGLARFTVSCLERPAGADALDAHPRSARQRLGLGLVVARGIVEAHGGELTLEGSGRGGTSFEVTLPVAGGVGGIRRARAAAVSEGAAAAPATRAGSSALRRASGG